jgi:hypothetical protein
MAQAQEQSVDLPYIRKAKSMIVQYVNMSYTLEAHGWVAYDDVQLVWCEWSTQGWEVALRLEHLYGYLCKVSYDSTTKQTTIDVEEVEDVRAEKA